MRIRTVPPESRRARLRRRIHLLPHLFTMGNLFAGYFAVSAVMRGDLDRAAIAIVIGWVLDILDGAVARLVQTPSRIGVQLDSLADIVTFGVAPALLAYAWGSAAIVAPAPWETHLHRLAWIASFAFLASGGLRLARFNVMSSDVEEDLPPRPKDAFVGMPIPAGAGSIAVMVHLFKEPLVEWVHGAVWLVYLFTIAILMASRLPFPRFRGLLRPRHPQIFMLVLALLLAAGYYYSEVVLYGLYVTYLAAVIASNLRRRGRGLNAPPAGGV